MHRCACRTVFAALFVLACARTALAMPPIYPSAFQPFDAPVPYWVHIADLNEDGVPDLMGAFTNGRDTVFTQVTSGGVLGPRVMQPAFLVSPLLRTTIAADVNG